ncbi:response regulator [Candidatus Gottesmanbacteria bacterium]|nr:response regulator [Candidatus Gottesmanbacteria bacterium]
MDKILLVDDDEALKQLYSVELVTKGYRVVMASDGDEALEKAKAEKPDLILLDIMMPKTDGIGALTKIKQEAELKDIPVLMLTNFGQENLVQQAFDLGAADYLLKYKVTPAEMSEKVDQTLHAKPVQL